MSTSIVSAAPARVVNALRDETVGGALLLGAAALAMFLANSDWSKEYQDLSSTVIGPHFAHLDLSVSSWAADALLAVFFFVAGLELKSEFVTGSLRQVSTAIVPVAAAVGGMVVPALLYFGLNSISDDGQPIGWGIPMATDIAFALAVLAVAGRKLPIEVRIFLLTLAVVDDLGAIIVIALFYSDKILLGPLLGGIVALGAYGYAMKRRITSPVVYVPLAVIAWICIHSAGVHATVAGIALGLLTRAKLDPGEENSPAERMQHLIHPFSAGFCVPVFAFFAAGVSVAGLSITQTLSQPVALGIIVGLVLGKPIGVLGGAWVVTKVTRGSLADAIGWRDVSAVGLVAGVGFTVSLLISELAFSDDPTLLSEAKLAVLTASVLASILATITLFQRSRHHAKEES